MISAAFRSGRKVSTARTATRADVPNDAGSGDDGAPALLARNRRIGVRQHHVEERIRFIGATVGTERLRELARTGLSAAPDDRGHERVAVQQWDDQSASGSDGDPRQRREVVDTRHLLLLITQVRRLDAQVVFRPLRRWIATLQVSAMGMMLLLILALGGCATTEQLAPDPGYLAHPGMVAVVATGHVPENRFEGFVRGRAAGAAAVAGGTLGACIGGMGGGV